MNRFKAYEPLAKKVQQIDADESEMRRLEGLKTEIPQQHERLLESGRYEDERTVAIASTLQTKLAMVAPKLRQITRHRDSVEAGMGPDVQALRNELSDERDQLAAAAMSGLVPAIAAALKPFLGYNPDHINEFAERIAADALVVRTICRLDPLAMQSGPLADQGRNLLGVAALFERIREAFFKGESLDLSAVAKKTQFRLEA